MKVGTDGVLLGAWAPLENDPNSILDIGAGTGLISLMLAQRSKAEVLDAVEIDGDAYEQCVENFEASPWGDRLFCYHAGMEEFVAEMDERYDLIVTNPPFYTEGVSSGDGSRDQARKNESLPFEELLEGASTLLSPQGVFAVILPFKEEDKFVQLAATVGLFPKKITRIKGNPSSEIKRSLIAFRFEKTAPVREELTIEKKRHDYTSDYRSLTRDFYLKM